MKFTYRYFGQTGVEAGAEEQAFRFAPDVLRPPTHFSGALSAEPGVAWAFREALSALHAVVVSDMRPRGRDKTAYRAWLADNEGSLLAQFVQEAAHLKARALALHEELRALRARKEAVLRPFVLARSRYFNWLYEANRDAWFVLDPVITVHPGRLLFEAFSQDESSYCAVSVRHDVFRRVEDMACGTTNIDYSASLLEEFQKIRDYKTTRLTVDPQGFSVRTADDPALHEEKIELPDSWVRGFLQVSSAMTLPATVVELHPMDLHNLCAVLRQHKERAGPRSLRFELSPGQPARMVMEPWNITLPAPRSVLSGTPLAQPCSVRVWGRRRLLTLERLIPVARRVRVHLLGSGMPSFWVVDLGDITVTLGLSGWSANDWSGAGRSALLQPRHHVPETSLQAVASALQSRWVAGADELARETGLPAPDVHAALGLWVQAGRAVFDLSEGPSGRYAWRELTREPLPLERLRHASPEEAHALTLVQQPRGVTLDSLQREAPPAGEGAGSAAWLAAGQVRDGERHHAPRLRLNADEQIVDAHCDCNFFRQNRLRRGPCAHVLALRQVIQPRLNEARVTVPAEAA